MINQNIRIYMLITQKCVRCREWANEYNDIIFQDISATENVWKDMPSDPLGFDPWICGGQRRSSQKRTQQGQRLCRQPRHPHSHRLHKLHRQENPFPGFWCFLALAIFWFAMVCVLAWFLWWFAWCCCCFLSVLQRSLAGDFSPTVRILMRLSQN